MAEERELDKDKMLEILDRLSPLNLFPLETRGHLRAAQKEMLLACRSLVDAAIQCIEEAEKPRAKKRTKIEVQ